MIEPSNEEHTAFEVLSKIDVSKFIEKKGNLSYLSWSHAWNELLKNFPDSTYRVYENVDGFNYHHDSKTAWVKTGVIVQGVEHIEYLPVMDFRNKSIKVADITSMDVNKAIQRSLTKAIGRHGLGLYIYSGEDLPSDDGGSDDKRDAYIAEFKELAKMSDNEKAKETAKDIESFKTDQIKMFILKLKKEGK
jgi:hypothetical protein